MVSELAKARTRRRGPGLAAGLAGAAGLVGVAVSCLDSGGGRPAGQRCSADGDCAQNLVCRYGRCRPPCAVDRDCGDGGLCIRDGAGGRVCALGEDFDCEGDACAPVEIDDGGRMVETCSGEDECPSGFTCGGEGHCVPDGADGDADVDADGDADGDGDGDADGGPICPEVRREVEPIVVHDSSSIGGPTVVFTAGADEEVFLVAWVYHPEGGTAQLARRAVGRTSGTASPSGDALTGLDEGPPDLVSAWEPVSGTVALAFASGATVVAAELDGEGAMSRQPNPVGSPSSHVPGNPALAALDGRFYLAFGDGGRLELHETVPRGPTWTSVSSWVPTAAPTAVDLAATGPQLALALEQDDGPSHMLMLLDAEGALLDASFSFPHYRTPAVAATSRHVGLASIWTVPPGGELSLRSWETRTDEWTEGPVVPAPAEAPRIAAAGEVFVLAWASAGGLALGVYDPAEPDCWDPESPSAVTWGETPKLALACDGGDRCLVVWVEAVGTGHGLRAQRLLLAR